MSHDYVGDPTDRTVFVIVASREKFDKIKRPEIDHSKREGGNKVLSKTVEQDGVMVIFQHWLE